MDPDLRAHVLRRARAATARLALAPPPFLVERAAARCGISAIRRVDGRGDPGRLITEGERGRTILTVDRRLPPRTPQWNGHVAMTAARTLLPPGATGADADELVEMAAAELLLPARAFRPIAARTDLTMDGLRDLARRFSAPIRLAARQWLLTGTWAGYALLWRDEPMGVRLRWRAASAGAPYPATVCIGARADDVWQDSSRLDATLRTGRPHHGVEEVRTGSGASWWFTRFGIVREDGGRAVLAIVVLDRHDVISGRARSPEGIDSGPSNKRRTAGRRSPARRGR